MLLESFLESYWLIIVLIVGFGLIMVYYFLKNRKFQQTENDFQSSLKVGDKVKTYSGFYGVVEKITETTDGKVVTLKLGENAFIDVDIRALMGIDHKEEVKEQPVEANAEKVENVEAEAKPEESVEDKPAEVQEPEKPEEVLEAEKVEPEQVEVAEEKPAKKSKKK